jgi:hypothetical protein
MNRMRNAGGIKIDNLYGQNEECRRVAYGYYS